MPQPTDSCPLLPARADVPGLPAEVVAGLHAGTWSSAAVRWAVGVSDRLQAAAGSSAEEAARRHDAAGALLLVRAATAALALVSDVGFEAAVRHLSQEYSAAAARVRPLACCEAVDAACGDCCGADAGCRLTGSRCRLPCSCCLLEAPLQRRRRR